MKLLVIIWIVSTVHGHFDYDHDSDESDDTELDALNVDTRKITLSGFSSGGTFAQHMQISYSSLFVGIAVFSHSYYRCGPGNGKVDDYDRVCTKEFDLKEKEYYDPELAHADIKQYYRNKQIENPDQLRNKRLYVYTGLRSSLFTPAMGMNILRVYERYIRNFDAIRTRVQDAGLVMPTDNKQLGDCAVDLPEAGFAANCGFSGAYDALNFLLPDDVTKKPTGTIGLQHIHTFDQTEFYRGIYKHQMDTKGYLYTPQNCKSTSKRCLLHFFFHGCLAGREFNGTRHIKNSGLLEVAELNNIIMVFPQAKSSLPENKIGCWDTFGMSGPLYATQEGSQVKVVKKMLDKFIGNFRATSSSSKSKPSLK